MRIDNSALDGLLAQRGLRYSAFARILGMSVTALTYIRNHEIKPVTGKKVADALGVDPKYIIVGGESLPDMVAAPVTLPSVEPAPPPSEPPKPKRDAKPKEPPPAWATDYEAYMDEARAAFSALYADDGFAKEMEDLYPNKDIKLSIRESFRAFWGTELGWENKKEALAKHNRRNINWKLTLRQTIKFNLVDKKKPIYAA
jgi:hypothetical protein